MKSAEKVIISFAAGVGLGAILGVLFAPNKGTATRRRIKATAEEYYTNAGEMIDEINGMVVRKGQEIAEDLRELRDEIEYEVNTEIEETEIETK